VSFSLSSSPSSSTSFRHAQQSAIINPTSMDTIRWSHEYAYKEIEGQGRQHWKGPFHFITEATVTDSWPNKLKVKYRMGVWIDASVSEEVEPVLRKIGLSAARIEGIVGMNGGYKKWTCKKLQGEERISEGMRTKLFALRTDAPVKPFRTELQKGANHFDLDIKSTSSSAVPHKSDSLYSWTLSSHRQSRDQDQPTATRSYPSCDLRTWRFRSVSALRTGFTTFGQKRRSWLQLRPTSIYWSTARTIFRPVERHFERLPTIRTTRRIRRGTKPSKEVKEETASRRSHQRGSRATRDVELRDVELRDGIPSLIVILR